MQQRALACTCRRRRRGSFVALRNGVLGFASRRVEVPEVPIRLAREDPANHGREHLVQIGKLVLGVERCLIVLVAELFARAEVFVVAEPLPGVLVPTALVEVVVALKDLVVRKHPPRLGRHVGPQQAGGKLAVRVWTQQLADVVQQGADDVLLVASVGERERRALQRVLIKVAPRAYVNAAQLAQQAEHAVRLVAPLVHVEYCALHAQVVDGALFHARVLRDGEPLAHALVGLILAAGDAAHHAGVLVIAGGCCRVHESEAHAWAVRVRALKGGL
mmetsp:Transcript_2056/g.8172  ORF Transcript_2056/g.8172 Transcript_2056/m.8172 type:complete len:275 (-) Transcript_2056:395-1219(-)